MKINWYLVAAVVFAVVAAVGWYQYLGEHDRYQALLSQQPTPPPTSVVYGVLEKIDGSAIIIGILEADNGTGTLVSTRLQLAADVSILSRNTQANEYVAARVSDLELGTWLQIGTDSEGMVVSITAGQ